jgi:hypothetical protein
MYLLKNGSGTHYGIDLGCFKCGVVRGVVYVSPGDS